MTSTTDIRDIIKEQLAAFSRCHSPLSFRDTAIQFFVSLGYDSARKVPLTSVFDFLRLFDQERRFDHVAANVKSWNSVHILFQLTETDFCGQPEFAFEEEIFDRNKNCSYMFIAVDLKPSEYRRGVFVSITRNINRLFSQPVMILFRNGKQITLAISNRRQNKVSPDREVLGKVVLIHNIDVSTPHRGHLDILRDISRDQIRLRHKVESFNDLHSAFEQTFSVELLNKRFYGEIAGWYRWAVQTIKMPINEGTRQDERKSLFAIRLLCRLIFCWFLKEKNLVSRYLFEFPKETDLQKLFGFCIKEAAFNNGQHYYRGVLQCVFFSRLNIPMGHGERKLDNSKCSKYLAAGLSPSLFDDIPYLNGGLFDRLDDDNNENISVPNELFFATVGNLNGQRGLNTILDSYKFTVAENTPLEQEIALDPELLGLIFENLLAEIDPVDSQVAQTARRASGSYYTPRQIIDSMVREALRIHFDTVLRGQNLPEDHLALIAPLVLYDKWDTHNPYAKSLAKHIVAALDSLRLLDPACGSGAFLMGAFHRIVEILYLVDRDNNLWRRHCRARLPVEHRRDMDSFYSQNNEYSRKMGVISNSLYGIDIQPVAVLITKLRFFISLLAEQHPNDSGGVENFGLIPFPNLETKVLCANTLYDVNSPLHLPEIAETLILSRDAFSCRSRTKIDRESLLEQISSQMNILCPELASIVSPVRVSDSHVAGKDVIKQWFRHPTAPARAVSFAVFFPEVCPGNGGADCGFDIVIGNPPYGGTKIPDDLKSKLCLGSRDIYGAFISRFLRDGVTQSPLRAGGVLAYIVSDTFMTLKTHRPLRKQLMGSRIHKIIRVHPDTFSATVNTAIILLQKGGGPGTTPPTEAALAEAWNKGPWCQMVDLTQVSIHSEHDRFLQLLENIAGGDRRRDVATESCAVYHYPQSLIATNTNLPFFVASPKLFRLMNDTTAPVTHEEVGGKQVPVRTVMMNGRDVRLVKLRDIAEVKQGLATGDNDVYLFQKREARGTYRAIEDFQEFLLNEDDLERIRSDETLRLDVIHKGISKDDSLSPLYFSGRYIVPYDKGGESASEEGWMPNYRVLTNYYIDWSDWALNRMRTLTIGQRDSTDRNMVCAVFRSPDLYFKNGISFSRTGVYAPTFRFGSRGPFDTEGSMLFFPDSFSLENAAGICASRLFKYQLKAFIGHTLHTQVDELKEAIIPIDQPVHIAAQVVRIKQKQQVEPLYDYSSNEQLEIDKLVYDAYGLGHDDIAEIETWYARRYDKLAAAQRRNLCNAGKMPNFDRWNVYCDETGHLAYDPVSQMVLGALLVPRERVRPLTLKLRERLSALGWPEKRELKWTKVSQSGLKFYETALDFFLSEPDLRFRALIAPKSPPPAKLPPVPASDDLESPEWANYQKILDDTAPAAVDYLHAHDAWYYDRYFDLLRDTLLPPAHHSIFVDVKDTRGGTRIRALEERLSDAHYDWTRSGIVEGVSQIASHEVLLDQLVDLLLGCVAWTQGTPQRNAGHAPNPGKSVLAAKFLSALEHASDGLIPKIVIDRSLERSPEA